MPLIFCKLMAISWCNSAALENEIIRTIDTPGATAVSFYHWQPSPLPRALERAGLQFVRVLMPQDFNCSALPKPPWGEALCPERASAAECSIRTNPTLQVRLPGAAKLIEMFAAGVDEELLGSMFDVQNLVLHNRTTHAAVDATSIAEEDIACMWLRRNRNAWREWTEPAIAEDINLAQKRLAADQRRRADLASQAAAEVTRVKHADEKSSMHGLYGTLVVLCLVIAGLAATAAWVKKNETTRLKTALAETAKELQDGMKSMWRVEHDMQKVAGHIRSSMMITNPLNIEDVESGEHNTYDAFLRASMTKKKRALQTQNVSALKRLAAMSEVSETDLDDADDAVDTRSVVINLIVGKWSENLHNVQVNAPHSLTRTLMDTRWLLHNVDSLPCAQWYWQEDSAHAYLHHRCHMLPDTSFVEYPQSVSNQLEMQFRQWKASSPNRANRDGRSRKVTIGVMEGHIIKLDLTTRITKLHNANTGAVFKMDIKYKKQINDNSGHTREMHRRTQHADRKVNTCISP